MVPTHLDPVLHEYFAECEELSERVSQSLQLIEKGQSSADLIDSIYRDIHTLKGSSQLFGFKAIGDLGHAMESSLDPVRRNSLLPSPRQHELLFQSLDLIVSMIKALKNSSEEDFTDRVNSLIPKLIDEALLLEGAAAQAIPRDVLSLVQEDAPKEYVADAAPAAQASAPLPAEPAVSETASELSELEAFHLSLMAPAESVSKPAPTVQPAAPVQVAPPAVHAAPLVQAAPPVQVVHAAPVEVMPAAPIPESQTASAAGSTHGAEASESSSSIRVPVTLLDKLMTLTGEMVLVRNQVLQYANKSDHLEFQNLSQRLDVVTSEIQGEVMKTRMQPIGNVLTKFQRVVRDLAKELGKKIELSLSGNETELDKTLLEAIKDPLMHIVRNSCDHGIERIEDRKSAGKPESGQIAIRSFHEGGQVIIEITDNGKGLDRQKLTQKAVEKGILTPEKAAVLSEREAFALIFAPGFSTAAKVTNVSGRGVGMDVVKNNIEGIGGTVEIQSETGAGTTTRLKIPLTLAIVPAMIIRNGEERFAIPQVKLVELFRVDRSTSAHQIEFLQGRPIYRLRDKILPLMTLNEVLGLGGKNDALPEVSNIVVLNADGRLFGLIVDEVLDTAEVVVKPMSQFLKSLPLYSGATVLGDGAVALILDVVGIAKQQKLLGENSQNYNQAEEEGTKFIHDMQEFLLFHLNADAKHAIPLNLVHRLEEFKASAVERSGSQRVVRYRNAILPIISLNEFLKMPEKARDPNEVVSIIVLQKTGRFFGIEVNSILDVLNTTANVDTDISDRQGILGNLVTDQEVIVIVDVLEVIDETLKKFKPPTSAGATVTNVKDIKTRPLKILLVEDTAFFRKHVSAVLLREGHKVSVAENGSDALEILNKSARTDFDLVLSDIEMPKMNGLQLAQAVRKNDQWKNVPMIAITTKYNAVYVEEGKKAGFNAYLEKLNAEVLLGEIAQTFKDDAPARRNAS